MNESDPKLTQEQFDAEFAKLGPCPPWYRPLKRRRWHATYYALCRRSEGWDACLDRILEAIRTGHE